MLPGRSYLLKIGARTVPASVTELKHRLDVNNFDKLAAKSAGAQRGRLLQPRDDHADRLRPLRRQSRDRRLHPDRPRDQRDRGGGHDRPRAAARDQRPPPGLRGRRARRMPRKSTRSRRSCGSPDCRARASRRSPTWSRPSCTRAAPIPRCSTATTSATASTRTWASPTPTGSRTSAASARWRG